MENNCIVCGKEKEMHRNPYCSNCYNSIKNNISVYAKICNEWKLEAKQEESKYFYFVDEANEILQGKKNLVIGRKGEGKTAIAQYIYEQKDCNIFTEKLSFKNFPFNILYELDNSHYTAPNQYISIWKYLIYTNICKLMIQNNNINQEIVLILKKIYPETDNNKNLSRLIEKYTVKDFGVEIMGSGFEIGIDKERGFVSWIDYIDILEDVILEHIDDSKYFIIFDELDEDYKAFRDSVEKDKYFDLVTGLFKAVQDVKATFSGVRYNVFPLVFLRTDIFRLITYSDKNKWSDSLIRLEWSTEKIKALLQHRLNIVLETQDLSFEECWRRLFGMCTVRIGNRKYKKMKTFEYILRSTQNRPRDFIKYFQECARLAVSQHSYLIRPMIIKQADNEFSEYMKNEIVDELYSVLPEYEDIFAILSQIRKQTFNPKEFENKYNKMIEDEELLNRGAEKVLKILFDFSVIGNAPSIRNQAIFKYEKDAARFNFRENIIIHRGLYKALQIF